MEGSRILFTFYIMFNIQVFIRHVRDKIAIINKASIQPAYVTSRMQSRNLTQSVSESLDLLSPHLLHPLYHHYLHHFPYPHRHKLTELALDMARTDNMDPYLRKGFLVRRH